MRAVPPEIGAPTTSFANDRRGAAAIEFALVSTPFIMLLVALVQVSIFYFTQSLLDAGVLSAAETLRNGFTTGSSATLLSASALKADVTANGAGLVANNANSAVEIRQLVSLDSAAVPIVDGTVDYGSTTSVLVLRAQTSVFTFGLGFTGLVVQSAAIVRRQGT